MIRGMELWRLMQVAMMEMEAAVVMKILCVAACTSEPTPESEDEDENEEDVEETETPEYMVRMKRRSGWLTQGGKRNRARAGTSSAWQLQKLRRSKGHTVL